MMDVIPLSRPLFLFEGYSSREIRRADISRLRDTPILGWDQEPLPLPLKNDSDQACEVCTVNEFEAKLAQGFYAPTTRDQRVQGGYYDLARSVLNAAQLASVAQVSFVDSPYVSVGNFELLPADLARVDDDFGERPKTSMPENTTVADLVKSGKCQVERHEKDIIAIKASVRCFAKEVLRADLNGDGVQDILVHQGFQIVGGTLSWFASAILTRKSGDALLERVPLSFI
jgi:hypothetical protein